MPGYTLDDGGFIRNEAIEINAVLGCNLACRGCSHTSPILPRTAAIDPKRIGEELTALATVYRADHARILGGEPLLHPDIVGVIDAIRSSGITDRIRVVTNGLTLQKASDEFWQAVDEVYVSMYPGFELSPDATQECSRRAERSTVELRLRRYPRFRESYSEVGTDDSDLVGRIYSSCLIAHVWRCHSVVDGVFYKCPQSHSLSGVTPSPGNDGVRITGDDDLAPRLLEYLNDPAPLRSCQNCLGAVGRLYDHEQVRRPTWRSYQERPTEDLVDWDFLTRLEAEPDSQNDCIDGEAILGG